MLDKGHTGWFNLETKKYIRSLLFMECNFVAETVKAVHKLSLLINQIFYS